MNRGRGMSSGLGLVPRNARRASASSASRYDDVPRPKSVVWQASVNRARTRFEEALTARTDYFNRNLTVGETWPYERARTPVHLNMRILWEKAWLDEGLRVGRRCGFRPDDEPELFLNQSYRHGKPSL